MLTEIDNEYDLLGVHGAETFRDLPEGLNLALTDGAIGEIVGNPHDGAIMMLRITDDPNNPNRVDKVETVFFTEVRGVVKEG
jgi:hypothetical protein